MFLMSSRNAATLSAPAFFITTAMMSRSDFFVSTVLM